MSHVASFRRVFLIGLALFWVGTAKAASLYWDINGATADSGTLATGNWNGITTNWNTAATGTGGTPQTGTTTSDDLFFSSGSVKTGSFTVTLTSARQAKSLTFEEGTVTLNGGTMTFGSTGTITVNNPTLSYAIFNTATITGNIGITKAGPGILTFSGSNSYTGETVVSAGILTLGNNSALGTVAGGVTVSSGAQLQLNSGRTIAGEWATISGTGGNSKGAINCSAGSATWAGNVTIAADQTRIGAETGPITISGTIDSGGNIYKLVPRSNPGGTVTLSGVNSYLGGTWIGCGTLKVSGGDNRLPIGGKLEIGWAAAGTQLCQFDLNGQNQEVAGLADAVVASTVYTDHVVTNSSSTLKALTVNTPTGSLTSFGGVMQGTLSFVKTGAGTQVLSGVNTYTGATTINAGTLALSGSGSISSSATITVGSSGVFDVTGVAGYTIGLGQTLKGSGRISGDLTIAGAVNPGGSPGTINDIGTVTYAGGGSYVWEINDVAGAAGANPGWDLQNITGNLAITASSESKFNIVITGLSGSVPGAVASFDARAPNAWTITTASGGISGFGTASFNLDTAGFIDNNPIGNGTFSLSVEGNNLVLNYTAATVSPLYWDINGDTSDCGSTTPNGTWGGANAYWSAKADGTAVTANWESGGSAIFAAGADATGAYTVTLDAAGITAHNVTVEEGFATISGATLTLAGTTPTLDITGSGTIASVIAGTDGVTKAGDGALTLGGDNAYTGGTMINAGSVLIGHANALGASGTLSFNGGTLASSDGTTHVVGNAGSLVFAGNATFGQVAGLSGTGALTLAGSGTLTAGSHTFTVNNSTTLTGGIDGSGSITKAGAGVLTLGGSNTYSGSTSVNSGTLVLRGASTGTGFWNANGGILSINSLDAINNNTGTGSTSYLAVQLGGTFQYTGTGTETSSKYLYWNSGSATIDITSATGSLIWNPLGGTRTQSFIKTGAGTLTLGSTGTISGGSVTVNGGVLVLNGASAYTGGTTLTGGILNAGTATALGAAGSTITFNGGTLQYDGSVANLTLGNSTITINTGAAAMVDVTRNTLILSGIIRGNGSLTKVGGSSLRLAGINTYTGGTTINNGRLYVTTSASVFGTGSVTVADGAQTWFGITGIANQFNISGIGTNDGVIYGNMGAFRIDNAVTASGTITLNADARIGGISGTATLSGVVTGNHNLEVNSGGSGCLLTLVLTGKNTYTGDTIVNSGTLIVNAGVNNSVASGNIYVNPGAHLTLSNSGTTVVQLGSGNSANWFVTGGTLSIANGKYEYVNVITMNSGANWSLGNGGSIGGLLGANFNLTSVTSSGTSTGCSTISSAGGALSASSGITFNVARGAFAGTSDLTESASLTDYNGAAGRITKTGDGILTLTGVNPYTGGTTISGGTLALSGSGSIGNSATIAVSIGAVFDVSGVSGYKLGSSQTLKGSGTIKGDAALNGTLSPGASAGSITFANNATLAASGHYVWEVGTVSGSGLQGSAGINFDQQIINGTLTLNNSGSYNIDIAGLGGVTGWNPRNSYQWIIATATGGIIVPGGGTFNIDTGSFAGNNSLGGGSFSLTSGANDLVLTFNSGTAAGGFYWAVAGDGTGTWDTSAQVWRYSAASSGASVTWSAGGDAVFSASDAATGTFGVTVEAAGVSANSITMNTGTPTLSGGTIMLTGSGGTVSVAGAATISSVLGGAAGLTKSGSGVLTMASGSASSYSGQTTINAGVLNLFVTSGNAIPENVAVSGGGLSWGLNDQVADGADITVSGGSISVMKSETINNLTISSTTGSKLGGLTVQGTLTISAAATHSVDSAFETSAGRIAMTGGSISIAANGGGSTLTSGVGGLTMTGQTISFGTSGQNGPSRLNLGGDVIASGANLLGNVGTTTVVDLGGVTRTFTIASGTTTIEPVIQNGSLTKDGNGTLTLAGITENTYAGMTTVMGGKLNLGKTTSASYAIPGNLDIQSGGMVVKTGAGNDQIRNTSIVNVAGGGTFDFNGNSEGVGGFNGGGTVVLPNNANQALLAGGGTYAFTGSISGTGTGAGNGGILRLHNATVQELGGSAAIDTPNGTVSPGNNSTLRLKGNASGSVLGVSIGNSSTDGATGYGLLDITDNASLTVGSSGISIYSGATGTVTLGGGTGTATLLAGGAWSSSVPFTLTNGTGAPVLYAQSYNATLSGVLSGSGGLTKTGTGTWTLSGNNSYTGTTTVNAGILVLGSNNSLGTTAGGVTVSSGAQLQLNSGRTIAGEWAVIGGTGGNSKGALYSSATGVGTSTWAGNVTIAAAGTRIGAETGNLTISGIIDSGGNNYGLTARSYIGGTVTLSGVNTYVGETYVACGALKVSGGDNRLPVGTTLKLGWAGGGSELCLFDLNGQNQEIAGLADVIVASTDYADHIVVNSSATLKTLTVNATGAFSFAGIVKGTLSFIKSGAGTQILGGVNTYTGGTTLAGGGLMIGNVSTLTLGGGTITFTGGALSSDSAAARSLSGTLTFSGDATFGQTSVGTGALTLTGKATLSAAPHTLTVNNSATLSGAIGGTGSLTKEGDGILNFSAINTYTGATTVNSGTLALSGSGSISSATIALGAGGVFDVSGVTGYKLGAARVLTGNGTVAGVVTVSSNAVLIPGAVGEVGTLHVNELILEQDARVLWDYQLGSSDVIAVSGALTLPEAGFALDVNVMEPGDLNGRVLFTYGSYTGGDISLTVTGADGVFFARSDPANNRIVLEQRTGTLIIVQ